MALGLESRAHGRHKQRAGQVAEWLKAHAWKVCIRETVSRVRIPPCPPSIPQGVDFQGNSSKSKAYNHPSDTHGGTRLLRWPAPGSIRRAASTGSAGLSWTSFKPCSARASRSRACGHGTRPRPRSGSWSSRRLRDALGESQDGPRTLTERECHELPSIQSSSTLAHRNARPDIDVTVVDKAGTFQRSDDDLAAGAADLSGVYRNCRDRRL